MKRFSAFAFGFFFLVSITPASPWYFLKATSEFIELKFADTSQKKGEALMRFADSRISEVKSLASTNDQDLIEPALIRYLSHLDEARGLVNLKDEAIARQVTNEANTHMNILQAVYTQVSHPRARMSVRAAVFRLTQWEQELGEKLIMLKSPSAEQVKISKLSGCSFLSKEASSSALSSIEKGIFAHRAAQCFGGNLVK